MTPGQRALDRVMRPAVYVAANCDGTFSAFVQGEGFADVRRPSEALAFIRKVTGRQTGCVPLLDRATGKWDSELDLAEGA